MFRHTRVAGVLLATAFLSAACGGGNDDTTSAPEAEEEATSSPAPAAGEAGELKKVSVVTSLGSPSVGSFPMYMAMEQGYFAEEGLEVEILFSEGSGAAVQQLAAGNAELGSMTPASIMAAVSRGTDMAFVLQTNYLDAFDIVATADSGITTMEDLKGKTLGVSELPGGEMPMVRASLATAGLQEGADVNMIIIGEGDATTVRALENGQAQAYSSSKRDVIAINSQGIETTVITPEEVQKFPGDGIAVTAETLEEDPEMVEGFVRASLKGRAFGLANLDATYAYFEENFPEALADDPELAQAFFDLQIDSYTAKPDSIPLAGLPPVDAWKTYMEFLQLGEGEQKALTGPVDVDAILREEVVEAAWEGTDEAAITAAAVG